MLINNKQIFLDVNVKNQDEAFKFIADQAFKLKITNDVDALINGLKNRELEGTTGFEDGFAIPHARIEQILKPAILCVRFKKAINWNSLDSKPTKVAIVLLVPSNKESDNHMDMLNDVAIKMMEKEFRKILKTSTDVKAILMAFKPTKQPTVKKVVKNDGLNIVGVTACIVGIAHTYMAEDKLLTGGVSLGHNVRIETQGSKGIGNKLTSKEIEAADIVIIAADTSVEMSRFAGKRVYKTKPAEAIKNPTKIIDEAIKTAALLEPSFETSNKKVKQEASDKQGVMQHILAGISYMIPVIVLGGICLAFSLGIAKAIWGPEANTMGQSPLHLFTEMKDATWAQLIDGKWVGLVNAPSLADLNANSNIYAIVNNGFLYSINPVIENGAVINWTQVAQLMSPIISEWGPLHVIEIIGGAAFTLMIPVLAGFIGNSIAGRAAIAPAMLGAFIGNNTTMLANFIPGMGAIVTPMGFIGAIIAGLAVGYFVRWMNTWNVPKSLAPKMPIFVIPLLSGIGISIIFIYVLGAPIGYVMNEIGNGIKSAYKSNAGVGIGIGLGIVLGAMASFDMGGPINKIAFVTSAALITEGITQPMGTMAAAIPVAPLGMGLTTVFFKRFFTEAERGMGISAIIMGTIGISEGAIPFAIRDPKRAIAANVAGGAVAGAIAGALLIENSAAHGGPIVALLGAVPYGVQTLYFFIAVITGVIATTSIYGFWLVKDFGKRGSVKEIHAVNIANVNAQYEEQISPLKNDKKMAKKAKNISEVEKLKNEIQALKVKQKQEIEAAKVILKQIETKENEYIKSQSEIIKQEKQKINEQYKANLNLLKNEKKQINEQTSLTEENKKQQSTNNRDKQTLLKTNKINDIYDVTISKRSQFVNEYQKQFK